MFYILRHGRTDWNEEHKLQGEVDIPLNETGRQMAYDAAKKYKDIDFDICYCSPLKRAQETARIFLSGRNPAVEIITDNRLHLCHVFTVDDLKYLHRGGRVSKTAAIARMSCLPAL